MRATTLLISLALSLSLPTTASATLWYYLTYWAPEGSHFTALNGTMSVPTLQKAGTYYLWPGLQPTDNSGVYQNVVDGNSGTWWVGSGWCCSNPNLPWGGGFSVAGGKSFAFGNSLGANAWTSTLVGSKSGQTAQNNFALCKLFKLLLWSAIGGCF
jgi:hypothetical protein